MAEKLLAGSRPHPNVAGVDIVRLVDGVGGFLVGDSVGQLRFHNARVNTGYAQAVGFLT